MSNNISLSYTSAFNQQFFDKNGKPLANGKLYTYVAGTNTPAPTYIVIGNDSNTNINTNPIILDIAGCADLVVKKDFSYRFVLCDKNNSLIKIWDNVRSDNFYKLEVNIKSTNKTIEVEKEILEKENENRVVLNYDLKVSETIINRIRELEEKVQPKTFYDAVGYESSDFDIAIDLNYELEFFDF